MVHPKLFKLHQVFVFGCLHLSQISEELKLPSGFWMRQIDRATIVWSCVIVATNAFKFLAANIIANHATNEEAAEVGWTDLLILNYLPNINHFASLYYGLMLMASGTSLAWRLYLKLYRPRPPSVMEYDAKREVIDFFFEGPTSVNHEEYLHNVRTRIFVEVLPRKVEMTRDKLLVRSYKCDFGGDLEELLKRRRRGGNPPEEYKIPIRAADFLCDLSWARWSHLAAHVYWFIGLLIVISIPLTYYVVAGMFRVNQAFGPRETPMRLGSLGEMFRILLGADNQARINLSLGLYGLAEQAYTICQLTMFFVFINIFVKLFHADLVYKAHFIQRDLDAEMCKLATGSGVSHSQSRWVQLKIWAFFDTVDQIDSYVSKYAMASLIMFSVGVSFVLSFLQVKDQQLKAGTLAAISSNAISYTYLHVISQHVETRSLKFRRRIYSIIARGRDPLAKRDWQRILNGFFQPSSIRTFTVSGNFPINLYTYSTTVTGLLAICFLVHKLFHRAQWDRSFSVPKRGDL